MLRRLIYISQSLVGVDPEPLDAILTSSVRWNAEYDVTGVLWAHPISFAQVLEGTPDDVEKTMERIRGDPRHRDLEELFDRAVLSRQYGDWSMRLAADDAATSHATAFMIGFAMGQRSASAKRLYDIVLESGGQGA
ncbi:BLUF domain-containing protein [Sphingomonas sp. DT-51]|uniref:BLUF domain-containing protein n=1 Tax=Sphingomonas sp. DT-51 TaxID=3396165 RepID=UPI003F1AB152